MNTLDPVHQRNIDGYWHDELFLSPRIFPPEKSVLPGPQTKMVKKSNNQEYGNVYNNRYPIFC